MNGNWLWLIVVVILVSVALTVGAALATKQPDVESEITLPDLGSPGVLQWSRNVECKELAEGRIWCDVKRDQP